MSFTLSKNLILAIVAQNENQALQWASEWLGRFLTERGYRHIVIDMFKASGAHELMAHLTSGEVAFAYGFAGVGSQFTLNQGGVNLWTVMRTPFMAIWSDHPAYNYRQHIVDSPYVIQAYHISDHMEARRDYLPPGSSKVVMLPVTDGVLPSEHCRPFRDRLRYIYFVKTGKEPRPIAESWKRHAPQVQEILWSLVELAKKDRNIDLTAATARLLRDCGRSPENLDLFMGLVAEADNYIRAWRSDCLARALLPHPAHIIGRGWDYLKAEGGRAEFFPPIPAQECVERVSHYRLVANANPLWRDGIHERVLWGIENGCVTITDRSVKSDAIYHGLPNYVGFEWQDNLQDVIADAMRLAERDEVDYLPEAAVVVNQRMLANSPNYVDEMLRAVREIRELRGQAAAGQ